MAKIETLKNKSGEEFYPLTHTKAVVDENGNTIEDRLVVADNEDIGADGNVLKFKDRPATDGMGYVVLRKNKSFQEQVTKPNTIYEIRYDFDLGRREGTATLNGTLGEDPFEYYVDSNSLTLAKGERISIPDGAILLRYFNGKLVQTPTPFTADEETLVYVGGTKSTTEIGQSFDYTIEVFAEIPENCVLKFEGGSLRNGTVVLNGTSINLHNCDTARFITVTISGNYAVGQYFFDTLRNAPVYWNGTAWVDANGVEVSVPRMGTLEQLPDPATHLIPVGFKYLLVQGTDTRPIYWNGTVWLDTAGAAADLQRKGTLAMRPNPREHIVPINYLYLWAKTTPDENTGGERETGEVVPIWWNGSSWQDATGAEADLPKKGPLAMCPSPTEHTIPVGYMYLWEITVYDETTESDVVTGEVIPILWNGVNWVYCDGSVINDAPLQKKGLLPMRPNPREQIVPLGYLYMWEKTEFDEELQEEVATGEIVPIWWNGQDWRDATGAWVAGTVD